MKDQGSENNATADTTADVTATDSAQAPGQAAAKQHNKASVAVPKSSSGVAWLSLILVIALGLGAGWLVREGQYREKDLAQRVARLEATANEKQANAQAISARWQKELDTGLGALKKTVAKDDAQFNQRLGLQETALQGLQQELGRFSASDRNAWLLAEAGHLLRLANQRLVMGTGSAAPLALLLSADNVLREIDDPSLHAVRAALAVDIATLRAVPKVDVEGIYLRLAALIGQAEKLVIFQLPARVATAQPTAADTWRGRLRQGYEAALAKLSDYLIIRRRDVPMQALMDPQWEGLVRQNLRMLLEQAQVALLSENQSVYDASLERAGHWVAQFSDSDAVAARAMIAELNKLSGVAIGVPQPDISRSLQRMDTTIEQRLHGQGGQ